MNAPQIECTGKTYRDEEHGKWSIRIVAPRYAGNLSHGRHRIELCGYVSTDPWVGGRICFRLALALRITQPPDVATSALLCSLELAVYPEAFRVLAGTVIARAQDEIARGLIQQVRHAWRAAGSPADGWHLEARNRGAAFAAAVLGGGR